MAGPDTNEVASAAIHRLATDSYGFHRLATIATDAVAAIIR